MRHETARQEEQQRRMSRRKSTSLKSSRASIDAFRPEAYAFLREGLERAVCDQHGEPSKEWNILLRWLNKQGIKPDEFPEHYRLGLLPPRIARIAGKLGGESALESRHVGGASLCRALRDMAIEKWGYLASTVLRRWGIRSTRDFGEMVFALVQADLLQKRAEDRIEDFDDVFDFETAFDRAYQIQPPARLP